MSIFIGCIADDFTGATDLANELQQQGLKTILFLGNDCPSIDLSDIDAVVVALKIRTAPVCEATEQALLALRFLQDAGCGHIYFKYCSTFDSSEQGNIGPITDALLDALKETFTIASPAFPRAHRTVYKGYLFVGDVLLSETHMQHHPLTPMTDSNLVRALDQQTTGRVCLISHKIIRQGDDDLSKALQAAKEKHFRYAIVDAIEDEDLETIGRAVLKQTLKLSTGASGVAYGLARAYLQTHSTSEISNPMSINVGGGCAVIAGSCSKASLAQIEWMKQSHPSFQINLLECASGKDVVSEVIEWASQHLKEAPILIHTSVHPDELKMVQTELGAENAGALAEQRSSQIAKALVDLGVRRLIVAGGETSGAVVQALGVKALRIGPEIDPGVPWTAPAIETPMALALKSGNFGSDDFFVKAFEMTS